MMNQYISFGISTEVYDININRQYIYLLKKRKAEKIKENKRI